MAYFKSDWLHCRLQSAHSACDVIGLTAALSSNNQNNDMPEPINNCRTFHTQLITKVWTLLTKAGGQSVLLTVHSCLCTLSVWLSCLWHCCTIARPILHYPLKGQPQGERQCHISAYLLLHKFHFDLLLWIERDGVWSPGLGLGGRGLTGETAPREEHDNGSHDG